MINIYCDESCHLQFDNSDIMLMGGLSCPKEKVRLISQEIRKLKVSHGLNENFEIKWTKVSNGQLSFYLDLLDLFFNTSYLGFRCVYVVILAKRSQGYYLLTTAYPVDHPHRREDLLAEYHKYMQSKQRIRF